MISSILYVIKHHFINWRLSPRYAGIFVLLFLFLKAIFSSIEMMLMSTGLPIGFSLFSFLSSDIYINVLLFFGLIYLLCDAPFISNNFLLEISRSGKMIWFYGKVFSIFITSFLYFLSINIFIFIIFLKNISFTEGWGKAIMTMAATSIVEHFQISLLFDYSIILNYSATTALVHTILLSSLIGFFSGLLLFLFNIIFKNSIGIFLVSTINLFSYVPYLTGIPTLYYISPTSWNNISVLNRLYNSTTPSILYAYLILAALIMGLVFILRIIVLKKEVDELNFKWRAKK